jgi:hypothetical protein
LGQFNVVKLFLSYARTLRVGGCLKGSNGIHQKYTQHNDTHYNVIQNNKLVITTFSITKNETFSITIDDYAECRDEAHFAECRYSERRYAERRGVVKSDCISYPMKGLDYQDEFKTGLFKTRPNLMKTLLLSISPFVR